jgi:hypothetical protein
MEHSPLYDAINFSVCNISDPMTQRINSTVVSATIVSLLCPSSDAPTGSIHGWNIPAPGNNYFASVGPSLNLDGYQTEGRRVGRSCGEGRRSGSPTCGTG